jgi:hypothetical protein
MSMAVMPHPRGIPLFRLDLKPMVGYIKGYTDKKDDTFYV